MMPATPGSMPVQQEVMEMMRTKTVVCGLFAAAAFSFTPLAAEATGFATCDSGPREGWQPQDKLSAIL